MKVKYAAAIIISSIVALGSVALPRAITSVQANPCAASEVNPCAANPCAANPCAADPCAANPCAANPCAANPCAANPCAANPCAAAEEVNPCAANPCAANPCAAATESAPEVYADVTGFAIRGADPVAYFTESAPMMGSPEYAYEWNGATWLFTSEENMMLFASSPDAYAPQYGGYCAKAVSEGNLASVDPNAWHIEDGKLYLNYSLAVQQQWFEDIPGNIEKADANWPEILKGGVVYE